MVSILKTLCSTFSEAIHNRQKVYLSDYYWNRTSDDYTCEILLKGRVLWVGLSFLIGDHSLYENMSDDSKKTIDRLSKAKLKFKFVSSN